MQAKALREEEFKRDQDRFEAEELGKIEKMEDEAQTLKAYALGTTCKTQTHVLRCQGIGGCNGFMSESYIHKDCYTCSSCDAMACYRCNCTLGKATDVARVKTIWSGHTCKEEDVVSVAKNREESRPCPTCKTPIHKSFGCNQMLCTECFTRFDYSTGEVSMWGRSAAAGKRAFFCKFSFQAAIPKRTCAPHPTPCLQKDMGLVHNPVAFEMALETADGRAAIENNTLTEYFDKLSAKAPENAV